MLYASDRKQVGLSGFFIGPPRLLYETGCWARLITGLIQQGLFLVAIINVVLMMPVGVPDQLRLNFVGLSS